MSSALRADGQSVGQGIRSGAFTGDGQCHYRGPTDHMSPRQLRLNHLWSYYTCSNYEGRKYDWNGAEEVGHIEADSIASSGYIPPGFYDAGARMPIKFRKPLAPLFLGKVIPCRFTSMLFSAKRHPALSCEDKKTEGWLEGFAEDTRFWSRMIQARNFGGGMGSVALGLKFSKGKPQVEVFDPRWCFPEFEDMTELTLRSLEVRYLFPKEKRQEDGTWKEEWFWYRRLITDESDTVWPCVDQIDGGEEPDWDDEKHTERKHHFGFCPAVWIQNVPVSGEIDGAPDCHGIYAFIHEIDKLHSQASRGTIASCDPTLHVASDSEFDEIETGSGKAIQTAAGESVGYVEMTGAGLKMAVDLAEKFQEKALMVAACSLEQNVDGASKSPEEIDHNFSAMVDQSDILREQYGECGVKKLFEMALKAARILATPRQEPGLPGQPPRLVSYQVKLSKKAVKDDADNIIAWEPREIGMGEEIELTWPEYFSLSTDEAAKRVSAAAEGYGAKLIDREHAIKYISKIFNVASVQKLVALLDKKDAEEAAALAGSAMGVPGGDPGFGAETGGYTQAKPGAPNALSGGATNLLSSEGEDAPEGDVQAGTDLTGF